MALSLRAEQKNITSLFTNGEDVYVIPEYQRPYSWSKDTCYQFYSDITSSFLSDEDYFIGNIIMARSNKEQNRPNVVDGQQRLITLWLFMKVLTVLHPNKTRLIRTLEVESVLTDDSVPRIESKVYEHDDYKNILTVLKFKEADFENGWLHKSRNKEELNEQKCSRIEANALYLYKWLKEFYEHLNETTKKENFLKYFLDKVFLLPIELNGETLEEASDKALTIFETLNNRGQILEDSDIFKARLYKTAKVEKRENEFIEQWLEFNSICSNLGMTVDDLFRYYYHILRGKEGQTSNEASLREYLTRDKNSALNMMTYNEIVGDLLKIADILQWLNNPEKTGDSIARWIQLINLYTNQYPKYALVNFLFVEGRDNKEKIDRFLHIIVQYYYYRGATLQVKYETYRINKLVAAHTEITPYDCSDMEAEDFEHIGLLKNGYALLTYYLEHPGIYKRDVFFDRLILSKDKKYLSEDWNIEQIDKVKNNIANIVVTDTSKCGSNLKEKILYYSRFEDNSLLLDSNQQFAYSLFQKRESRLKKVLMSFFTENNQ